MAITTSSVLPAPVQQHFHETMLAVQVPNLIHNIAAMRVKAPRKSGATTRFRRPNKLSTAPVPLGNSGAPVVPEALTALDIDATMSIYGKAIALQEQVTLFSQDPVLNWGTRMLGINLRETEDELTRDMLAASATAINAVFGTVGDVPTDITRQDVDNVTRVLASNDAYTMLDKIQGENRFGSGPVNNSYAALCSTNLMSDLEGMNGFLNVAQYPNQSSVLRSEFGTAGRARFFVSSVGSVVPNASSNGADVYNVFITGMDAYGIVTQDGFNSELIYRDPRFSDALAQTATLGWKTSMAQRILNDEWIARLRCVLSF